MGLGMAGAKFVPFPIDFYRRPYNTVALSCECVIGQGPTNFEKLSLDLVHAHLGVIYYT